MVMDQAKEKSCKMKFIAWIKKSINTIKTIGILILVVLFILSITNNGCQRRKTEELTKKLTILEITNTYLQKDIRNRDTLIVWKDKHIKLIEDSLKVSVETTRQLKAQKGYLQAQYDSLASKLTLIPSDSSYSFLIHEAYPFWGPLKYLFNEPQVKGMHLTYLQKLGLEGLNFNLTSQVWENERQLAMKDTIIGETKSQVSLLQASQKDLQQIVNNKDEAIIIKDKQVKKERTLKTVWKVIAGVLAAISIGTNI
jgi:hypothetical protein